MLSVRRGVLFLEGGGEDELELRRGISDEEVSNGTFTIFNTRSAVGKITSDARMTREMSEGDYIRRVTDLYSRILSVDETMSSSNKAMLSSVQDTCKEVIANVADVSSGELSSGGLKKMCVALTDLTKSISAVDRVTADDVSISSFNSSTVAMSARDYSMSVGAITQNPDMLVTNNMSVPATSQVYSVASFDGNVSGAHGEEISA